MSSTLLFLLAGTKCDPTEMVEDAAKQVFPGLKVRRISHVEEAQATTPGCYGEFLVLIEPHSQARALEAALAALDESALPRWPVLVLGSPNATSEFAALPAEEWNPRAIVRGFRTALALHAARRETLRASGDLKTIAHRLTHDLRAQLGGVFSAAELLQEIIGSGDAPKVSMLRPIFDSTEGTVKLLERISFVTRASVSSRAPEPLNMGLAFWAASQRLESQIAQGRASLVQPSTWPGVAGVTDWLEVVWWNLLANALQHSGGEPHITIGWEHVGSECRFWLKDDGGGIPVEKRRLLFHPFHRLHEPNAPNGLGLPIVQRLIRLQGGRCGYEPRPEGGSCFLFALPRSNDPDGNAISTP